MTLGAKTAFLCDSHRDVDLAEGRVTLMTQAGWRTCIDRADTETSDWVIEDDRKNMADWMRLRRGRQVSKRTEGCLYFRCAA